MATVLQKLKDEGWFISEDGLKKLNENGLVNDVKELTKRALDTDLRDLVTNGGLSNDYAKSSKLDLPQSGIVMQVVNVRNVSAPKANQESKTSPRLLQIDLTDGQTLCSGLDLDHLPAFNVNIAPGTKVLLKNAVKVIHGILSLSPQNINILGGQVAALYEKWETNRALAKYGGQGARKIGDGSKGSPPPWIPFGTKVKPVGGNDSSFKSLNATVSGKAKEVSKEESEFLAMRKNAIAEASAKAEQKKIFGGSNRQLIDHNVKKILDKGYTEEQAKYALKLARNNLERAMSNLKKRGNNESERKQKPCDSRSKSYDSTYQNGDVISNNGRRGARADAVETLAAKPSGKVSLFDFLEDKIKIPENTEQTQQQSSIYPTKQNTKVMNAKSQQQSRYYSRNDNETNRSKFENNISSSFASRQKKDDSLPSRNSLSSGYKQTNRSKWNENNESSPHAFEKSSKPTFPLFQSQQQQAQQQQQKPQSHYNESRQNSSNRNNGENAKFQSSQNYRYSSNQSQQQHQSATNSYQQQNNNKNNRYSAPNNNNNASAQDPHQYNDSNNKHKPLNDRKSAQSSNQKPKTNVKDLTDATANLQISNDGKQQTHQPNPSQAPSHQRSSAGTANMFEETFPQVAKRFPYNPYKIMGFQNKETNEFALNVLKTQMSDQKPNTMYVNNARHQASAAPPSQAQKNAIPQQQQQQQHARQDNYVIQSQVAQPPQIIPAQAQPQPPHAHIQHIYGQVPQQPPQQMQTPKANFINANVPTAISLAPPQQSPYIWSFKVGDRCLAKYWEDERYYNAEIQAVTDKTCVVHFLDYGNFEEVLLSDCLPITDANHQPINQYSVNTNGVPPPNQPPQLHPVQAYHQVSANKQPQYQQNHNLMQPPPVHIQYQQQQQQQHQHQQQQQQQHHQQRFRRQVYVPPAQRK